MHTNSKRFGDTRPEFFFGWHMTDFEPTTTNDLKIDTYCTLVYNHDSSTFYCTLSTCTCPISPPPTTADRTAELSPKLARLYYELKRRSIIKALQVWRMTSLSRDAESGATGQ